MTCASLAGALFAACAAPERAVAQDSGWIEPPGAAQRPPGGARRDLDFLFGALKSAPDETSARAVEDRIWAQWAASGSDTVDLLMGRAKTAIDKEDYGLAVRLLDAVVEIRPQYAEGWNRRAMAFFLMKDFVAALADLQQTLRREPRHFAALAGLGVIMQELGDEKSALRAFREAVAVHPRLRGMADKIRALADKVDGRPI